MAQLVKNPPAMQETQVYPWVGKIPWRRERQPTPVFLPREFHGQRTLAGNSPQGHKEPDTTEQLTHTYIQNIWKLVGAIFKILTTGLIALIEMSVTQLRGEKTSPA